MSYLVGVICFSQKIRQDHFRLEDKEGIKTSELRSGVRLPDQRWKGKYHADYW